MNLPDRLHCPECKGRLDLVSANALRCTHCEQTFPVVDGIADFAGKSITGSDCYGGDGRRDDALSADLLARIRAAAGERWPATLGDVLELGCGRGQMTSAIVAGHAFRSMLVIDTDMDMIRSCRARIATLGIGADRPVFHATLGGDQNAIRDAVADTVLGLTLLSGIGDVRAFLTMVHRVLKPGGRALFVVPNRRYFQALCQAMAEALVQRYARDGVWPDGHQTVLSILADKRRLLVHRGDVGFLAALDEKHLFDSEALEDGGREIGFATAEMIPLAPDPAGAETVRRILQDAGAPDDAVREFAPLVSSAGQPFFSLLGRQDSSASMLLWLTKGGGPGVRIFSARSLPPPVGFMGPETALGGAPPRWSLEVLARDTPDGIVVTLGGWCLCNVDVLWVRITLDGVIRHAPVWWQRPDVHEVLNRNRLYHPLSALCSGIKSDLLFTGVHAVANECSFHFDMLLSSGLIVTGPAPERLVMDEQLVITH